MAPQQRAVCSAHIKVLLGHRKANTKINIQHYQWAEIWLSSPARDTAFPLSPTLGVQPGCPGRWEVHRHFGEWLQVSFWFHVAVSLVHCPYNTPAMVLCTCSIPCLMGKVLSWEQGRAAGEGEETVLTGHRKMFAGMVTWLHHIFTHQSKPR